MRFPRFRVSKNEVPITPTLQTQSVIYTFTSTDILNGYAMVPVVWPVAYVDANYVPVFGVMDLSLATARDYAVGAVRSVTKAGFTAVVNLTAAIPLIQGQLDQVDSIAPTSIVLQTTLTALYQVTFYYGPADNTGSGKWSPVATWQDPAGNNLVLENPYLGPATAGDVNNYQSYSIPFFVKGGTPITITGAYSGASFPMNISLRAVQMPNNSVIYQPGDQITVGALSVYNTGNNPTYGSLQAQINACNAEISGLQTQIKQVTLTLEGELNTLQASIVALQTFVHSVLG